MTLLILVMNVFTSMSYSEMSTKTTTGNFTTVNCVQQSRHNI